MASRLSHVKTAAGSLALVDTGGPGLPLLMIHGSGSSHQVFYRQWGGPLAAGRRMIALDLPGHGASDDASDPDRTYGVTGMAEAVEQALARIGVRRAAIRGWSLGGHVAIEMLARGGIAAGVMVCGAPPVGVGLVAALRGFQASLDMLLASRETYSQRDAERFEALCFGGRSHPSFRRSILRADGRARAVFAKSLMRGAHDQRRAVLEADVPVAFVNGALDPFVRLSYFAGLTVAAPFEGGAQVVDGAGHAPFWTHPTVFNALLGRFLLQVDAHEAAARPVRAAS
jgi:pimeloyl-ACP methyl ester carboxylesterase